MAAQSCFTNSEIDPATRSSLESAAAQDFRLAQQNPATLRPAAEFDLAEIIAASQDLFQGQPSVRAVYLLEHTQGSSQHNEFFCGVYNSPQRVVLLFGGMPVGRYAVVIQDVAASPAGTVSWVFHLTAGQWRIAGLIAKPSQLAGHDGNWFLAQARAFRAKGQNLNAWLYYRLAFDLLQPLGAMTTPLLEHIDDELQQSTPAGMPSSARFADLSLDGRTVTLTAVFPVPAGHDLDLVVKYQRSDISDIVATYQSNLSVSRGLVARYPELRAAFTAIVARALDPGGKEYGTLLALSDIQ
jgi:hypothetical protein